MASTTSPQLQRARHRYLRIKCPGFSKDTQPTPLNRNNQMSGWSSLLRPPIAIRTKYRNINLFPIDYAFLPRLRGRLTLLRLALSRKPWTSRRAGFSPALSLLMSAFALLIPPANLSDSPSTAYRTLLYRVHISAHPQLRWTV